MPAYGDAADDAAAAVLASAFPGREIVQIDLPPADLAERQPALRHHATSRRPAGMSKHKLARRPDPGPRPRQRRSQPRQHRTARGRSRGPRRQAGAAAGTAQRRLLLPARIAWPNSTAPKPSPAPAPSASARWRSSTAWCWWARCSSVAPPACTTTPPWSSKPTAGCAGKYRKMHIPDDPGFYEKFYFTPGRPGLHPDRHQRRPPRRAGVLGPVVSGRRAPDGAGRRGTAALSDRHRLGSRRRPGREGPPARCLDPQPSRPRRRQRPAGAELQPRRPRALAAWARRASTFWGSSHVLGPQGEFLAEAGTEHPKLLVADVDLAAQRTGAPHLAVPARPPHRCLRRPAQAVPRLNTDIEAGYDGLHDQPHAIVERDGVRYTLLGTAHVSQASVDAVHAGDRQRRLRHHRGGAGRAAPPRAHRPRRAVASSTCSRSCAKARPAWSPPTSRWPPTSAAWPNSWASSPAPNSRPPPPAPRERGLPLSLIDRDVGITLKRAFRGLGLWGRVEADGGPGGQPVRRRGSRGRRDREAQGRRHAGIELRRIRAPAARRCTATVIAERDRYMAARLRQVRRRRRAQRAGGGRRRPPARAWPNTCARRATRRRRRWPNSTRCRRTSNIPWFTIIVTGVPAGRLRLGLLPGRRRTRAANCC